MTGRLDLVLAGLRFAATAPAGVRLIERDPLYAPFLIPGAPADAELEVTLGLEPAPAVPSLPLLFDTEESWAAFGDGDDVVLRLRSAGSWDEYLWQARLAAARRRLAIDCVAVHCGPRLVEHRGAVTVLTNPLHYPLDQLLLMFALPARRGVLVHAAGLARGGRGVLLAGRSGAGKTTFMRLVNGRGDLQGLSDDRVVARRAGAGLRLFGTPWAGEGRVAASASAELAALAFLHQAPAHELRPIDAGEALRQLMATVSILWFDRRRTEAAMSVCEELVQAVPCYELRFRPEPGAVDLLDEVI